MNQFERYSALIALRRGHEVSRDYRAAFCILSATQYIYEIAKHHVDHEGIDFPAMKTKCDQLEESVVHAIDIAHNLFSYRSACSVTPYDISRLESPYMETVCNALYIASGRRDIVNSKE